MKNDLTAQLKEILTDYTDEVKDKVVGVLNEVGEETAETLKDTSPRSKTKRSGKYARGWRSSTEDERTKSKTIVHNSEYRLVHLLENGHKLRNGKDWEGIPHVEPANEEAQEKAIKRITEAIEKIK